ncbi:VTT domain-containing protein [Nocardiopsis sp. CNT-189]|uniref:DedA family protein n=1 Tax=Nocardiopsis oceanisediminis TaxID=2816862 RepID=UPI003B293FFD
MNAADLAALPPAGVYAVLAAVVFAETAFLPGIVLPSAVVMVGSGVLSAGGTVSLPVLLATAFCAAAAGDALAVRSGRVLGPRLRASRAGRRIPARHWDRVAALFRRHGPRAVLIGRFVPFLRTLAPRLAGASGAGYREVAPHAAAGAAGWSLFEIGAGRLLGSAGSLPAYFAPLCIAGGVLLYLGTELAVRRWSAAPAEPDPAGERGGSAH